MGTLNSARGTLSRLGQLLAALWLVAAVGPGPAWSQTGTLQEAVEDGLALLQQGRTQEAIDRLRAATEAFPTEPLGWLALGQAYETGRQPGEAIDPYQRVVKLAPGSEEAKRATARLDQLGQDRETYEAAQREFQAGVQALAARDFPTAESHFRRIVDRIPKHLPSLLFLGNIAEQTGRDDEAVLRWQAAAAIEPGYFPAQVNLGRLYERTGKVAEAAAAYRAAVETKATHPDVQFAARRLTQVGATPEQALQIRQWMQEAADALRAERVQDAQRAFERVLEALPMHAASSFALALMAAKRGQTIDAARLLKKGLEGDPDYYPALFLLAEIEAGQGQFDEAIAHFKRVVELVGPRREGIEARRRLPALEDASAKMKVIEVGLLAEARKSFNEGIAAFQKQDYETAFKAFGRAMVLDEKNPYYLFNRGLAAFNLGNNLVAAQSFERVLELAPTFGLAHFWLGVMFQASAEQARDAGNLPEAEAEYKAVVDRFTQAITHGEGAWYVEEAEKRLAEAKDYLGRYQESLGFLRIGEVLIVLGRLEEAVTVFSAATQRFQYDFQPWLNIGAVLTDLKRFDDAKAALEQASRVNPKSPKPYIQLGYLFEVQERLPDAAATYRKVIEMAPDQPDPHASLGAVLMQMDQPDDAVKAFERAVELSGGTSTPRVHFSLAFLYLQRGQATLALTHYRKTRDLLAGRTEREAVDIRRTAEDSIATLEERLRPYRFTLRATPWNYDSNIASATTNAVGEAYSQVGGSVSYLLVNEERLKLRGVLDHSETYYLLVLQQMFTATSMLASLDYTLSPVLDVNGAYRWTYSHGTNGPQALSQALSTSVTRRGQLPSSMALGLSYGTSSGLGASTVRNASLGYSVSMSQSLAQSATLEATFSATSVDSNRDDQVNQTKNLSIRYSRTLWESLRATLTYGLGLTDFVNPFRVTVPRGDQQVQTLIFLQGTATNIGLNLSRQFRNDVTVSLGMDLQRQQSNFSLDQSEDVNELLNQLVQARGSFRKRTVSLTVTKEF